MRSYLAGNDLRDLGKEWMEQVGNDESEIPCSPRDQRTSREIGLVIQFTHSFQNAFARLGPDVRVISQYLRDRHNREAHFVRDVFEANCHRLNIYGLSGRLRVCRQAGRGWKSEARQN